MRLEKIADVIVGQIMSRVTSDKANGKEVTLLAPKAISKGLICSEELESVVLCKDIDEEKFTREGDVVIKLSTPYDAAYVDRDNAGLAVPSFCAVIRVHSSEISPKYLSAYLNSEYVREILKSKVLGGVKPMIKVSDIRALEIYCPTEKDMSDIGEAYVLSARKRQTLLAMADEETKIMDGIVMNTIKEAIENE